MELKHQIKLKQPVQFMDMLEKLDVQYAIYYLAIIEQNYFLIKNQHVQKMAIIGHGYVQ